MGNSNRAEKKLTKRECTAKTLMKAEENYRYLLKYAPTAIFEVDYDGPRFKSVNDAMCKLIGYSREELLSINPFELLGAESSELLKDRIRKRLAGEFIDQDVEYKVTTKDGRHLWTVLYVKPVYRKGKLYSSLVVGYGITERKKTENELRDSEERFRLVAEAAKVFVYEIDLVNNKFEIFRGEEILGYDRGEIPATFGWWFSQIHPDDSALTKQSACEAVKSGRDKLLEYRIKCKQGNYITVHDTAKMVKDERGKVIRIIGGLRDITERKMAEEALAKAQVMLKEYANNLEKLVVERTKKIVDGEQNYRELYESFGEAFIATDWELNVIHWNKVAEKVTKVKAEDALGKKVYAVLPEMATVDITPYFEDLQQHKPVRFMMNTISRETGFQSIFEISTYPSNQGIIIIVEDKTEEEKTKRLSAIGATAGMVGHDIRNPLQAMINDVFLLKDEITSMPACNTKEGVVESIESIEKNISYINKIVADLQDYSRPIKPEFAEINLSDLVAHVLQPIALPENLKLSIEIDPSLTFNSDPTLLRRILSNLIINASQAMPRGGKLRISGFEEENKIQIAVEDNGVGIPDDFKTKIFNPMVTTKAKGQGFGLVVVKRLVEALNGIVSFESQEGKGTKFIIKFRKL